MQLTKQYIIYVLLTILLVTTISAQEYPIYNCSGLQNLNSSLNYYLANDIDCTESSTYNGGNGHRSIVDYSGTFDGRGYTITNLWMNTVSGKLGNGMFENINGGNIYNLHLENITVNNCGTGACNDGGVLARIIINTHIENVTATGSNGAYGTFGTGGLIGRTSGSGTCTIKNSGSAVNLLTGLGTKIGGLIGRIETGSVLKLYNSYSTGDVYCGGNPSWCGGLVGVYSQADSLINNSWSSSQVVAKQYSGGLVGVSEQGAVIENSFSYGTVNGTSGVGGLVGFSDAGGNISNCFSSSQINPSGINAGAIVGEISGVINLNNIFYLNNSYNCTGNTNDTCTEENVQTYFYDSTNEPLASWDFSTIWEEFASDYPHLLWENLTVVGNCTESWIADLGSCLINDTQLLTYHDENACGTTVYLPPQNGTYPSCNYCTISYHSEQTDCLNETITTYYVYDNFDTCCDLTGIPADCDLPSNSTVSCATGDTSLITGLVIDTSVEVGRVWVGFAGLVAMLGLFSWIMFII